MVASGFKARTGRQAVATIRHQLGSIAWAHRNKDMDDPTRTERIRRISNAAKKEKARRGMKSKQSKAIVESVLTDMIGRISRRTLAGKRDAAILQFGFFSVAGAGTKSQTPGIASLKKHRGAHFVIICIIQRPTKQAKDYSLK